MGVDVVARSTAAAGRAAASEELPAVVSGTGGGIFALELIKSQTPTAAMIKTMTIMLVLFMADILPDSCRLVQNRLPYLTMTPHPLKKVKIVASLGPKSDSKETILKLAEAGVDVFRFNFSHCNREEAMHREKSVRIAEKKMGRKLTIMADLMGPKIRIGVVSPDPTPIKEGEILEIVFGAEEGTGKRVSLNIPHVLENLVAGDEIYLGDGDIKLQVESTISGGVRTRIIVGGDLRARMGFQARTLALARFELSEKDKNDIKTALEIKADAIAVSFVQTADDILAVRALLPKERQPYIVVKLETLAGVENAEKIMEVADVLMIARGDLAFAAPLPELPHIQKQLINLCLRLGKPVITATQMLESMTWNYFPTRAEVTDVANAILDGTDAVMTSGETAKGKHPVVTIETMVKIIETAEKHVVPREFNDDTNAVDGVTSSATKIANQVGAKLIVAFTESGATARLISRHRPTQPIIALCPNKATLHDLNYTWGVYPKAIKQVLTVQAMMNEAKRVALKNDIVQLEKGDSIVVVAGIPFGKSGATNMVLVQRV